MTASVVIAIASTVFGPSADLTYFDTLTDDALRFPGRLDEAQAAAGGGIYVTDQPTGSVLHFMGDGSVVGYEIAEGPVGIGVHPDGQIFISRLDGVVGIYDDAFVQQGALDPSPFSFLAPNDIAVHPDTGEVYVVDGDQHFVLVFDGTTGTLARMWGIGGLGLGEFIGPQAIAIDPDLDRVLVTDVDNFRVQVFNTSGVLEFKFGYRIAYVGMDTTAWFARSAGIAVDLCHNIYVTDALMGTVRVFDSQGQDLDITNPPIGFGTDPGELKEPCDIHISDANRIWIANTGNGAVEVYDAVCEASAPLMPSDDDLGMHRDGRGALRGQAKGARRQQDPPSRLPLPPDNPFDIVEAMHAGIYDEDLDLNADQLVDIRDLRIAVVHFGAGSVEDFLSENGGPRDEYPFDLLPPHMRVEIEGVGLDNPVICGRCHSMDGLPGGMLSDEGQENLCLSCHTAAGLAMHEPVGGAGHGNSHAWGVPADNGEVMGPEPDSDLSLHLDEGEIRCGTCHNPHEDADEDSPYMRLSLNDALLCKECHRGEGSPQDHAEFSEHSKDCTDCHDLHAIGNNLHLIPQEMDTWANGHIEVSFTDDTLPVGPGGFVDPDPDVFGICEACHDYPSEDPDIQPPHVLDGSMPLCTECHQHHNGFMPGYGAFEEGEYVGAETCSRCHVAKHGDWSGTRHAGAWDTLDAIFNGDNPVCLVCHTVGFGEEGGFVDIGSTPELAGVQCENCHDASGAHVSNNHGSHPTIDKRADLCGGCHTGSHHPTYDEWETSGHAESSQHAYYGSCYACHKPLGDDPEGMPYNVDCVACHDPHAQTGNAEDPDEGHDYQLLYQEVVQTTPSNDPDDAQDPTRFNLCGQCHHSRGRMWDYDGRAPHHSVQGNMYVGEMPVPDGVDLVPFTPSDHAVAPLQCVTCHMYTAPHEDGPPEVDAITGHSWDVNFEACAACHGSAEAAETLKDALQAVVQARLDAIAEALGPIENWEYIAGGGPPSAADCAEDPECTFSQDDITDDVKKVRFLYHYILSDASLGMHNATYVGVMLDEAESLLGIGPAGASYIGSWVCAGCHEDQAVLQTVHAHSHKLTPIAGGPPTYPPEGIYAGIPNTPVGSTWDDVSYVIGGYYRKARFITLLGNIMIGADDTFDGAMGVETQWNLEFPPAGSGLNWAMYHQSDTEPKPYNYSCFQCHTTGPVVDGGFEEWAEPSVQCEACHGPGSGHLVDPGVGTIVVDTSAAQCGTCHIRGDDPNVVLASGGYIRHHEQWPELLASPHDAFDCVECHEPHTSAYYDPGNAITKPCIECHAGMDLVDHDNETFVRDSDGYTEDLTCVSCHMAHATKSAAAADSSVIGPIARMGDVKTHVFNINTDAVDYTAMFTPDGSQLLKDGDGEGAVTLDFVCLRCHNGLGNAPDFSLNDASDEATGYHD